MEARRVLTIELELVTVRKLIPPGALALEGTTGRLAMAQDVRAISSAFLASWGLVGFSRGAFVARDVIYARPGRYRGVVLIGAALAPDPQRFKDAGIERVVLASGELDGAYKTMRGAETKLRAAGIELRFVSLGKVYHTLPADTRKRMADAMRWVTGPGVHETAIN